MASMAEIKQAEKELAEVQKAEGEYSKRAVFLMSFINYNLKKHGKQPKYSW